MSTTNHRECTRVFERDFMPVFQSDGLRRLAARIMQSDADAEELIQATAARCWEYMGRYVANATERSGVGVSVNPAAFVRVMMRNLACSWHRHRQVRQRREHFDEIGWSTTSSAWLDPEESLAAAEELAAADQVVDSLPDYYAETVRARYLGDMTYREVAAALDIPLGTVMSRLSRAHDMMRAA